MIPNSTSIRSHSDLERSPFQMAEADTEVSALTAEPDIKADPRNLSGVVIDERKERLS